MSVINLPRDPRQRGGLKKYAVVFFESMPQALAARDAIIAQCVTCDQLNIVIRAEGNSNEATLLAIDAKVKVYAGAAWWLIHERRKADGWYDSEQE